ncbi:chalcone isomerase family protein [Noviherbaspirillum sp. UKPF54]|uniref:chalcone isomerase family protein n=1 Tax=Noviherbaspirillum sp. UKPF54 TaxID=2601898 RepID=UPI001FED5700|nr:chalcone isomerase family protein [Noviherbaspirillum sp. UKPF54]
MKFGMRIKQLLIVGGLVAGFCQAGQAAEVAGIKFDDTAKVGGKELKLNGAGARAWAGLVKVYAIGMYLPEKKTTPADVLATNGPRRMKLVLLRKVNNEELGQAFMDGLNKNSDKAEKSKFVDQTVKMGEVFASISDLDKGSVIVTDYIPDVGLQVYVNDKKIGEPMAGIAFANAYFKIWLGDKPADSSLKEKLLGN